MKKGTLWIVLGILFFLGAIGLTVYNMADTVRAGNASQSILDRLINEIGTPIPMPDRYSLTESSDEIQYPDYFLDPTREMPHVTIDGVDYVGVLEVPALDIALPVCMEWNYYNLEFAPCRYHGTAYQSGFVICAHNYVSHFGQLRECQVGDRIYYTDMDGNRFAYQIEAVEILAPRAVKEMVSPDWDLSLFTCTVGGASRVTVRCVRVDE